MTRSATRIHDLAPVGSLRWRRVPFVGYFRKPDVTLVIVNCLVPGYSQRSWTGGAQERAEGSGGTDREGTGRPER